MFEPRYVVIGLLVSVLALSAGLVLGQAYPTKPIRIVTANVGGGADILARVVAQGIAGPLGQQVVVENRPPGRIPGEIVAHAQPDGYTLLVLSGQLWVVTLLQTVSYDPVRDFSPITLTDTSPSVAVLHPSVAITSVKDLIAFAKAKPGTLNASTGGTGGSGHMALELFKSMAGVNIVRVPYSSGSQEIADLLGGQVQMTIGPGPEMSPHIKSGKVRALAVTSAQPSPIFPELPTVAATGLPGYEWVGIRALFAPAKTPVAIINRLNQEVVKVLGRTDIKERFFNTGSEITGSTPERLAAVVKSDMVRLSKLVKEAGIKAN